MKKITFLRRDLTGESIKLEGEHGGYTVDTDGTQGFVSGWVSNGNISKTVVVPFDRLDHMTFEDTEAKK